MRNERVGRLFRLLSLSVLLLLGAMNIYGHQCEQKTPADLTKLLIPTIQNNTAPGVTWWKDCLDPNFNHWPNGGSQNLPVVSAAIGMFIPGVYDDDMPVRIDYSPSTIRVTYIDWWTDFLEAQVGANMDAINRPGKPTRTLPGHLRYFHSRESFSNIYDAPVVATVVAINYWAQKNASAPGAVYLGTLARKYLRATWAIYGLAAGPGPTRRHKMGYKADLVTHALTTVEERNPVNFTPHADDTEYNPKDPLRSDGTNQWSGNFIALPGQRSKIVNINWVFDDRFPLLARALGTIGNYRSNESTATQKALLEYVQGKWVAGQDDLYGLSNSDRWDLNSLISSATGAATVVSWLNGIRLNVTFRILGWSNGIRASMMETNNNFNDTCMYAVKYDPVTDPTNKVATFLFTWWDNNGSNAGWAKLEPGLIRAYHPAKLKQGQDGIWRTVHPEIEAYINIPTSDPTYHVVLSQNANPYLDGTPQNRYPPMPPPREDWPPNALLRGPLKYPFAVVGSNDLASLSGLTSPR